MLHAICEMAVKGSLKPPKHEICPVDDFKDALGRASDPSGKLSSKLIFKF